MQMEKERKKNNTFSYLHNAKIFANMAKKNIFRFNKSIIRFFLLYRTI